MLPDLMNWVSDILSRDAHSPARREKQSICFERP
jgi:hypothetical protein